MRTTSLPRARRLGWALAGLLSFLWVGYEDRGTTAVLLVSAAICSAVALQLLADWMNRTGLSPAQQLLRFAAWGLAAGLGIGPAAALLMLLKLSLHSHGAPDFTLLQVLQALWSAPLRAAQGAALGLVAGGLWLLGRRA